MYNWVVNAQQGFAFLFDTTEHKTLACLVLPRKNPIGIMIPFWLAEKSYIHKELLVKPLNVSLTIICLKL